MQQLVMISVSETPSDVSSGFCVKLALVDYFRRQLR